MKINTEQPSHGVKTGKDHKKIYKKMQQIKKLTLAELKEKANTIEKNEVMEKIEGGMLEYCHGFWGQLGKTLGNYINRPAEQKQMGW